MPRNTNINLRRGLAVDWQTTNPILDLGEPGYDITNNKLKIGDGNTPWNLLPYFNVPIGTCEDNSVVILTPSGNLCTDEIDSRVWGSSLVDGAGTANYIPRWNDSNTLIDSIIYDNGTNVGIGTSSPSEKLDVNGKIKSTLSYTAMHSATNLAVGWYTVAVNNGNRAIGRFGLTCSSSARHQGIIFYASHFFGLGNQISVLHNNRYSLSNPVAKLRIKEGGTYDGCLLQVYIDDALNTPEVYLLNDNINTTGWVVVDWVPDGTNPGGVANFAALTNVAAEVDLDTMDFGTTGQTSLDGPVVINEGGNNNDFRVEGDTDANLLFVDASTERVGIGTNNPSEKLQIDGSIRLGTKKPDEFPLQTNGELILFSDATAQRAIACNGDGRKIAVCFRSGITGSIRISEDGGKTWATKYSTTTSSIEQKGSMSLDGKVIAFCFNKIVISVDGGETWTEHDPDATSFVDYYGITVSRDGTLVVVSNHNGRIWFGTRALSEGFPGGGEGFDWDPRGSSIKRWNGVAISDDKQVVYAAASDVSAGGDHVYKSSDGGYTWTAITSSIDHYFGVDCSSNGQYVLISRANTVNSGILFTSSDSGVTLTQRNTSLNVPYRNVAVCSDGSRMVAVGYGGNVYYSSDYGVSWTSTSVFNSWWDCDITENGYKFVASTYAFSAFYNAISKDYSPEILIENSDYTLSTQKIGSQKIITENLHAGSAFVSQGLNVGTTSGNALVNIRADGCPADYGILNLENKNFTCTSSMIRMHGSLGSSPSDSVTWHFAIDDTILFKSLSIRTNVGGGEGGPEVTIDPSGLLYIAGDKSIFTNRYLSSTFNNTFNTASQPAYSWSGDEDNGMFRPTTNTVAFSTNGLERLRIDSNGNVRIGASTFNPSQKLDIRYPAGGGMALIKDSDSNDGLLFGDMALSANNTYQGIKHPAMTGISDYMIISDGGHTYISSKDGSYTFIRAGGNSTTYQIQVAPTFMAVGATAEAMVIDSAGVVFNEAGSNRDFRVEGDTLTHLIHADASKDEVVIHNAIGYGLNYATSEGWVQATGTPTTSQVGYYGGNFTANGAAENYVDYSDLPNGSRGLVWQSRDNGTDFSTDGGWDKEISGLDPNKTYVSIVYFRRVGSSTTGNFYHGCKGTNTLNLNGTTNINPYFHVWGMANFPQDVWCVSIGIIHANNDTISANTGFGGIYRLDTGEKIYNLSTDYKMAASVTTQTHRTYLYYDTVGDTDADWCWPGFYEVTADSIVNLLNTILYDHFSGRNITINEGGGNYDFRVEGDTDQNLLFTDAGTDRVGVGTSSPVQKLQVDTSQLEIAGFHYSPLMGPIGAKQLQSLIVESRGNSVILKHLENPFAGSTMELQNLIRYGSDFISIDAAYSGVLGITYYPKLKVNTSTGATTFNDAFTLPTTDGSSGQALVTNGAGVVSWSDIASANLTRGSFEVTSTQSVFTVSGGYTLNTLSVYYNGVKLLLGTDFTATNGTTFTLTNAAVNGDIVEYWALNSASSAVGNTSTGSVSVTSNQTVFNVTNGYTVGGLIVFVNGVKLVDGVDFTATNGSSFTLTSTATSGDVVDYIAYGAVVASSNLQKTGDTMTGNLTIGNGSDLIVEGDLIVSKYKEGFVNIGNTGSTQTIDIGSGTLQTCILNSSCTFTMPTAEAGRSFTLLLKTGTGSFTSTFTNVKWPNDTAPTITTTASKMDILTFVSDGVNWYGNISQNYSV